MVWDYIVFVKTASIFSRLLNWFFFFLHMFISYVCHIHIKHVHVYTRTYRDSYNLCEAEACDILTSEQHFINFKMAFEQILNSFINDVSHFKLQINGFTDHCKVKCVSFHGAY